MLLEIVVLSHLEGFHDRDQTGNPPGLSIFTFSSPVWGGGGGGGEGGVYSSSRTCQPAI